MFHYKNPCSITMGLLFLAFCISALATELGGHWGVCGDEITWWSVDSHPLSPPQHASHGMENNWFTTYPASPPIQSSQSGQKKPNGHKIIRPSTDLPPDNRQPGSKYNIVDLRNLVRF